jgi:hypothetical protein
MRARLHYAPALVACVLATAAPSVAHASVSSTPYEVMSSVLAAGEAQISVKSVSTWASGAVKVVLTSYAATSSGYQNIDYAVKGVDHHEMVKLVGGVVYVRGDATILNLYMGLTKGRAKIVAGKWYSIASTNPDFAVVASDLTVSSTMSVVEMTRSVVRLPDQVRNGVHVTVLKGQTIASSSSPSLSETLYSNARDSLPVMASVSYQGKKQSESFSNWGRAVRVSAPSRALPFSVTWLQAG